MTENPVLILDPHPRTVEQNFTAQAMDRLESFFDVKTWTGAPMPADELEKHLPNAVVVIGQTDLPAERLRRAPKLRGILNVEGNFMQNIDYEYCFRNMIHVLNCGNGYAQAVAEMALGLAISLGRRIPEYDRKFRAGEETYLAEACLDSYLLSDTDVGLIGFGSLGRALRPLLVPFRCRVMVYDPWLPSALIEEHDCVPASLDDVLTTSKYIFILAGVTSDNQGFLDRTELEKIPQDACVMLMSRAAIVDFDAFVDGAARGRFRAATDVFPEEPLPKDHLCRTVDGLLLSPHRAGGIPQAFHKIGDMCVDDAIAIGKNLPPALMQKAQWESAQKLRSEIAE